MMKHALKSDKRDVENGAGDTDHVVDVDNTDVDVDAGPGARADIGARISRKNHQERMWGHDKKITC